MIIVITGATASGKSDISFRLASLLKTEIISADSRQVYRYFDIGTAKPSIDIRKTIKHHFIDIIDPDEEFNVGDFCTQGTEIVTNLQSDGKIPLISGGTGLYIKALIEGYSCGVKSDKTIREKIDKTFHSRGSRLMYERLKEIDPAYAEKIHPNDKVRIARALEVFYISGRPFSSTLRHEGIYDVRLFVLERDRKDTYRRIDDRVEEMFKTGLVEEVEGIIRMGYSKRLKPFQSIGYRQVIRYIEGEIDYERCVEDTKMETRQYAKRQFTWFNGVKYAEKIYINKGERIEDTVKRIKEKVTI